MPTIIGSPVIIQHKDVTEENADELRCGVIANAYFNQPDGWYYVDGIIWDDKAQDLINKGWSVSCSYDYLAFNDEGGEENNIHYDKEFTQLNFTHLAIVNNPRYERANIVFNCKVDNGEYKKWPAGDSQGRGGQFAPQDGRSFKNYTFDILKRAVLGAGIQNFETSKSGYAVRFTIPEENFRTREGALAKILDKDSKVDHYSFGGTSEGQRQITIQFKKKGTDDTNNKIGNEDGKWVTIKGTHVFIPDGKSVDEVIKEKFSGGESKDKEDLKGKYERDDVDWDEEQLKKDLKAAQDLGYSEVEDIAEFLGLDEDEVRETLAFSGEKKEDGESQLSEIDQKILALKDKENKLLKEFYEAKEGSSTRQYLQSALDTIKERRFKLEDERDGGDGEYKYSAKQLTYGKQYWPKDYQGPVLTFIGEDNGKAYFREGYDAFNREAKKVSFEEGTKFASYETGSNLGKGVNPLPGYMLSSGSESNRQRIQYIKEHGKPSEYENGDINNSKEQDMAIIEELKKLIFKVENNKENETMVENEKVDKRKLIDEVAGIMKSAGCDDEDIRTAIGKMEKIGYDDSEASADNKKVKNEADEEDKKVDNEEDDKEEDKVDNESDEDKEKAEDLKEDEKKDVDNKCKNSVENAKGKEFFDKINKIYNSAKKIEEPSVEYESKQARLEAGKEYFG